MATRMQQRRGTAAQWTAANPILAAGEIGFETDTSKFKMGNGSSAWSALTYFANATELAAAIDAVVGIAPETLDTLSELAGAIGEDPNFFSNVADSIASSIDQHNGTITVHGIANTALLATLTHVSDAQTEAETFATTAVTNHSNDTTMVHGIDDTAALARTADVTTDISNAVSTHSSNTTSVHGIDDTADLATKTYADGAVSTHSSDTTEVHGISNTADLATKDYADTAVSTHSDDTLGVHGIEDTSALATKTYADGAVSTHQADTLDVHGIPDTSLLATQDFVTTAIGNSEVDQSALAGVGLDWNSTDSQFDIDSTVATKTHVATEIGTHNSDTESVHGIADTSLLATTANVATAKGEAIDLAAVASELYTDAAVLALTKSSVGLENVDNTSDANKPVSTATQTALDLKAPKNAPTFTGTVTSTNDMVVDGNLTVNGTTFSASSTSITIEDNIVQLAHQNVGNSVDLGLVVAYNDGAAKHSGLVRDVSDAKWKLFKGVTTEPTTTVDFTQGSLDDLAVAALTATTITPSSGVVFSDGTQTLEGVPSRTPIIQKTASYTLSTLTERDDLIEMSSSSALTLTIPTDATLDFPIGTSIDILQTSTGQVTIAGAVGVTVNSTPGLKLRTTWSSATLFKRAANTWVVYGDLTA